MILTDILPLLFLPALLVFVVPSGWKWPLTFGSLLLGAVAVCLDAGQVLYTGVENGVSFGFGMEAISDLIFGKAYQLILIDPLSALFIVMISVAFLSALIYARGYLRIKGVHKTPIQLSLHYFCLLVLYASMLVVVMAQDGLLFLFAWELMTLSSFLLVLFDGESPQVRRAALNYLILMHVGFFFLVAGFTMLYQSGLPVQFQYLDAYFEAKGSLPLFLVFLVGFGMKAGIFPLHTWLPEAHPAAPAHVSALMSGVMIKMGVYGILRVVSFLQSDLYMVGLILFVAGLVTGLWGVVLAALQHEIKRLLAYSSIENVGIILLAVGLSLMARSVNNLPLALCALSGAILHTLNHSFFKTLLYLGSGSVALGAHTTRLDELGGLGRRMPLTAGLFLLGSLALCAFPPLCGFVSEFLIYRGLLEGIANNGPLALESLAGLVGLAFIGGLVVIAVAKLYGVAFQGQPRTPEARHARESGPWMLSGMALPAAGILVAGLGPWLFLPVVYEIAGRLLDLPNGSIFYELSAPGYRVLAIALWALAGMVLGIWLLRYVALARRPVAASPTWGCGFTAPTPRLQYTGESFSEGLASISERVMNRSGHGAELADGEIFPAAHDFELTRRDRIDRLFSRWWLGMLRRINASTALLRTGKVNHYILFAMLFLLLVFVLSLFGWL